MTNTKFRKRALLSSVAMLLVALVALGSATFAWFTANPEANATGIKYSTTTGTGLLAKAATDTNGYSHNTGLWGGAQATLPSFSLQPASIDAAADVSVTKFYTADADEDNSYKSTGTITSHNIAAVTDATGTKPTDFYAEKVYLKTTGGDSSTGTLHGIKVTYQTANTSTQKVANGVRIAILDKNDKLLGIWGSRGNTYAHDNEGTVAFTAATTKYTAKASGTAVDPNMAITGAEGVNYVTVLVFLDGEDEDVKSTQVANGAELLSALSIDFNLNAYA